MSFQHVVPLDFYCRFAFQHTESSLTSKSCTRRSCQSGDLQIAYEVHRKMQAELEGKVTVAIDFGI